MALLRSHRYWIAECGDFKVLWHAFFQNEDLIPLSMNVGKTLWLALTECGGNYGVDFQFEVAKDTTTSAVAFFWIAYFEGSQCLFCEDTQQPVVRPDGKKLNSHARTRISIPVQGRRKFFSSILLVSQLGLCKKILTREEQTEMY